jgi:4-carboxymuconolactone decarboxylase
MADSAREKGIGVIQRLFGKGTTPTKMPEAFGRMTVEHLFGDVWSRPNLEITERSLITLSALIVLGRENELKIHIRGARNLGIPRAKIEEVMIHLAHYGGWPVAVGGFRALEEVWSAMDAEVTKTN